MPSRSAFYSGKHRNPFTVDHKVRGGLSESWDRVAGLAETSSSSDRRKRALGNGKGRSGDRWKLSGQADSERSLEWPPGPLPEQARPWRWPLRSIKPSTRGRDRLQGLENYHRARPTAPKTSTEGAAPKISCHRAVRTVRVSEQLPGPAGAWGLGPDHSPGVPGSRGSGVAAGWLWLCQPRQGGAQTREGEARAG